MPAELSDAEGARLLEIAEAALDHLARTGASMPVRLDEEPATLQRMGASFVTLRTPDGALRGCIGSAQAMRPLAEDVALNTHAAATRDPRFASLTPDERPGLRVSISVLSPLERIDVADDADLVAALRPGIDGLLLVDGDQRGTLLPAVWDHLPEAARFVREVKAKAGWPADYWSETLAAFRYTTQSYGAS